MDANTGGGAKGTTTPNAMQPWANAFFPSLGSQRGKKSVSYPFLATKKKECIMGV